MWRTNRPLTAANLLCRLARAFLPVASLFVGKLIIDEVVRLAGAGQPQDGLREWLASGRGYLPHLEERRRTYRQLLSQP